MAEVMTEADRRAHVRRSAAVLLPAALLLLLACGKSTRAEPATDGHAGATHGGQRLQAMFIESADGDIGVFRHFRDTELELDCNFTETESRAENLESMFARGSRERWRSRLARRRCANG